MAAHDTEEAETRLSAGETVAGRYRVDLLIGRGGMGEVYRAEHLLTGQQVALKLVRRSDDEARRRLLREARAASKLKSPHTARVLDADTMASGDPFLVFELLEGQDLASILRARGRLSTADAIACIAQAAEALTEAHALGIVHRDVKPSNLFMVAQQGHMEIKVLDFGIAKLDAGSDTSVTVTGSVMGSPRYMSPEQIRDPKRIDARTDVWSLGVTLHELLTGYAPFEESYAPALCAMITSEPPNLRLAVTDDASARLTGIIDRCLAKDRRERFTSAAELAIALRAIVLGETDDGVTLRPTSARTTSDDTLEPQDTSSRDGDRASVAAPAKNDRRRGAVGLAVAAIAALAAGTWWARQAPDPQPSATGGALATSAIAIPSALPVADDVASPPPTGSAVWEPMQKQPTAVASLPGTHWVPRPITSSARRGSVSVAASATPHSSAPPLNEHEVLKDRR